MRAGRTENPRVAGSIPACATTEPLLGARPFAPLRACDAPASAITGVTLGIAGFTGKVQASTYPFLLIGASLVPALGGLLLGR